MPFSLHIDEFGYIFIYIALWDTVFHAVCTIFSQVIIYVTFLDLEITTFGFPRCGNTATSQRLAFTLQFKWPNSYFSSQVAQLGYDPWTCSRKKKKSAWILRSIKSSFLCGNISYINIWIAYVLLRLPFKQTDGIFPSQYESYISWKSNGGLTQ